MESENQQPVHEKQKLPETAREYTFESGVEEIMRRIEVLLTQKDYVVVEINASGINVGKTTLNGVLARKFKSRKIPCVSTTQPKMFMENDIVELRDYQEMFNTEKRVILFNDAHSFDFNEEEIRREARNIDDGIVKQIGDKFNLGIERVDIMVALYSPQRPFSETPVGDIVIRNEHAKDK